MELEREAYACSRMETNNSIDWKNVVIREKNQRGEKGTSES